MSDKSLSKLLERIEISPKRLLDADVANDDYGETEFYKQLNNNLKEYKVADAFGDIIFEKPLMEDQYVTIRVNPFREKTDKGDTLDILMNIAHKNEYTDNLIVYYDGEKWINTCRELDDKLKEFIAGRKTMGKPEASLNIVYPTIISRISRLLLVIGGIGCGKTTFLTRYLHLHSEIQHLWIDFSFVDSSIDFNKKYIFSKIRKKILQNEKSRIGNLDYRSEIFRDLISQSRDFFYPDGILDKKRLDERIQQWFEDDELFVNSYLLFKSEESNFILIFDNIDIHKSNYQLALYEYAKELIDATPKLKIILSMREYSYGILKNEYLGTLKNQPIIHITSPNAEEVLEKRFKFLAEIIKLDKVELLIEEPNSKITSKFSFEDTQNLIENLLFPLLQPKSIFMLRCLSNYNIKQILYYINMYLSSPYLLSTKFIKGVIQDQMDRTFKGAKISFDEFLQIMLLCSRRFYDQNIQLAETDQILNVYQVEEAKDQNYKFLVYRIIAYVLKHGQRRSPTNKKMIIETVSKGLCMDPDKVRKTFNILLETGTLESPDGINLAQLSDVSLVYPTRKAWYYCHRLSKFLIYIRLIRNDLFLNYEHQPTTYSDWLDEKEINDYLLFVDWIRRIEKSELKDLKDDYKGDYLQLVGEIPICLKVLKSILLRLDELVRGKHIEKPDCSMAHKKIRGLFLEIRRDINQGKILPAVGSQYLEMIKDKVDHWKNSY